MSCLVRKNLAAVVAASIVGGVAIENAGKYYSELHALQRMEQQANSLDAATHALRQYDALCASQMQTVIAFPYCLAYKNYLRELKRE